MDVVIIDDGVNKEYLNIDRLEHDLEIDQELNPVKRSGKRESMYSHGTVCAAIITKYAPSASISSIKVLDPITGAGRKEHLAAALHWCLKQKVKLISVSIGTTQFTDFDDIRILISQLYRQGCIIVAAYNNQNIYTMPASVECTIGVRCNNFLREGYQFRKGEFESCFEAGGRHEIQFSNGQRYVSKPSNSYAAPYITACVYNRMTQEHMSHFIDIRNLLSGRNNDFLCHFPDFIDCAAVVDMCHEEWQELFYFQVASVYSGRNMEALKEIKENVYLVVLAENTAQLIPFFKAISSIDRKCVKGIFCCGSYSNLNKEDTYGFHSRIWQETYYLEKYTVNRETDPIEIPLIYIYGERRILIEILKELHKRFAGDGYYIKIIGEFRRAYLYGFEYSDNRNSRQAVVHNVHRRFQCDIIICGMDSPVIAHDEEDMCFRLCTEERGEPDNADYITIYTDTGNAAENADNIYHRIVTAFI